MEATGARVARDKTERVAKAWTLEMRIKIRDKARHVDVEDCIFSLLFDVMSFPNSLVLSRPYDSEVLMDLFVPNTS